MAAEPQLQSVFNELFASSGGCEIYLRQPQCYGLRVSTAVAGAEGALQWAQVAEAVRLRGDSAMGMLTARGQLLLGPDLEAQMSLLEGDRLVVMAEQ